MSNSVPIDPDTLSYARCAETRAGRAVIRGIENLSGRKRLIRSLLSYPERLSEGKNFWDAVWEQFDLQLDLHGVGLEGIPKTGPLVCVANHPFGILDGFAFSMIVARARPDFKILANEWLVQAPEIMDHVLPIDREPTRAAMQTNIRTRRAAIAHLRDGGCIAMFPAGTVSASRKLHKPAFDAHWKTFTASLIKLSDAQVTPIFFHGQNSRLFQIACHVSETLRLALFVNEFDRQIRKPVSVTIGEPIQQTALRPFHQKPEEMMTFLRSRTYSLSPDFVNRLTAGKPWG
ncbi:MAG: lysophospholipid acyltransferase family protein [Neomegalonema sp.]|nr:lysophospholipid acyltransferase family protein [Neomegalonema sp.]